MSERFSTSGTPEWPRFPRNMMTASSAELTALRLNVLAGAIPSDLRGHVFMVAPVGSVTSNGLPNPDGSHVWNGNGLIFRFDFDLPGEVRCTSRLAKTPCYYADLATRPGTRFSRMGFRDFGMARFSLRLGMRNQLNTAFVPMKFGAAEGTRLLVTFDGGRPYEIDPVSLRVVTPVGSNSEWQPGMNLGVPFPPVLGTAHPGFDPISRTLFTVNYGRSLANFLATIPLLYQVGSLPGEVEEGLSSVAAWFDLERSLNRLGRPLRRVATDMLRGLRSPLARWFGIEDFVHLLRWDGQGSLQRWRVVDERGQPIRILQTMHQIGVSRDYVVLMDTSLKFGLEQILDRPLPLSRTFQRAFRSLLTRPQNPSTTIFLIPRDRLIAAKGDRDTEAGVEPLRDVVARRITLPLETGHFLVDYENPDGRVTLHLAHQCATDVSEWISRSDVSPFDGRPLPAELEGMIAVGAMDVGRLGRYVIDGRHGTLLESQVLADGRRTWGVGLYTSRDAEISAPHGAEASPPGSIRSIYWQSLGFWPDLLPAFIHALYEDYPHRLEPLESLWPIPEQGRGRPSSLFRVDTATMTIADAYDFPVIDEDRRSWDGHVVNSPQFVPRTPAGPGPEDTDGYVLCTVIAEGRKELWIFDGADLAGGPLCRLGHPDFSPGYTIHTTWLASIEPRRADYRIAPRQDYEPLLAREGPATRRLFEEEVFPHFEGA